jgi:DHA1 family bicyclomycin/chloramphenicol resistance-like MFS transporter
MNDSPGSTPALMSERRATVLGVMLAGLGPISLALYTPALPEIVEAFGTTEAPVKMTVTLFFAGFVSAQLICGPLSDAIGRRPTTLAFLWLFVLASIGTLLAPSIGWLIVARFIQGVGAAAGMAVSRAIVRDLFTGEASTRIMNVTGLIMAVGPGLAPTVGGVALALAGWQSTLVLMLLLGIATLALVQAKQTETARRGTPETKRPTALAAYAAILRTPWFLAAGVVLGGTIGGFYTLITVLPFIVMGRFGLSGTEFGLSMLVVTISFMTGALVLRQLSRRRSAYSLVPIGLAFNLLCSAGLIANLFLLEPSVVSVMAPIALFTFGNAFILPAMTTAALAPFPHIAGAAASLANFLQMGMGLLGSAAAALFSDSLVALITLVQLMSLIAISAWLVWRKLPEPPAAGSAGTALPDQ